MLGGEAGERRVEGSLIEPPSLDRNGMRYRLEAAVVLEVRDPLQVHTIFVEARCPQHVAGRRLHLREFRLDLSAIQLIGAANPRSREVVADIREEQAERRGEPRIRWHDDLGNAHL